MPPPPPAGRFAPSPSGDLHLGNLRTAVLAWLAARSTGRRFVVRVDDLDREQPGAARRQLEDLAALGLDWDGPVQYQSARVAEHHAEIAALAGQGRTFECYCTRREIAQAASAPHAPQGAYPGTCRDLTRAQRERRRAEGRPPAVRLRADVGEFTVVDLVHGHCRGVVDDVVLQRNDGIPAYNLTVVLDDAAAGVDQVVRGDDLLPSTPRQAYLATVLGLPVPQYAHVPLVLGPHRRRLAKRDGAVTLRELLGEPGTATPGLVLGLIGRSLGLARELSATPADLLEGFDIAALDPAPWVYHPGHPGSARPGPPHRQ